MGSLINKKKVGEFCLKSQLISDANNALCVGLRHVESVFVCEPFVLALSNYESLEGRCCLIYLL